MVVVLFNAGVHIPVILSSEVVGNADKVPPVHIAGTALNVGVMFGLTVITIAELFAVPHEGVPASVTVTLYRVVDVRVGGE